MRGFVMMKGATWSVWVLAAIVGIAAVVHCSVSEAPDSGEAKHAESDELDQPIERSAEGVHMQRQPIGRPAGGRYTLETNVVPSKVTRIAEQVDSTGPLQGNDLDYLRATCATTLDLAREELGRWEEQMDFTSTADMAEQAELLYKVMLSEAMFDALMRDQYIVTARPPALRLPDGVLVAQYGVRRNGTDATATVIVDVAEYPELTESREFKDDVRRFELEELVSTFNRRPLQERAKMIERYDEIRKTTERSVAEYEFWRTNFPSGVRIDRRFSLLEVRRSRSP